MNSEIILLGTVTKSLSGIKIFLGGTLFLSDDGSILSFPIFTKLLERKIQKNLSNEIGLRIL